jgi:hypothetical protein
MSLILEERSELLKRILNNQPKEGVVEEADLIEVGSYYWLWDEEALEEMTDEELTDIVNCIDE